MGIVFAVIGLTFWLESLLDKRDTIDTKPLFESKDYYNINKFNRLPKGSYGQRI